MRAFLMGAILAVTSLTVAASSARADYWHRGRYYHGRPPVVVVRPAPIVMMPAPVMIPAAPVVVAPPTVVAPGYGGYAPAPVFVAPVRPLISLRFGR